MNWNDGFIYDVEVAERRKNADGRGWLAEIYRRDETPLEQLPVMAYVSETSAGVKRGPHEHQEQTDRFVFLTGKWKVVLWDARPNSRSYGTKMTIFVNDNLASDPRSIIEGGLKAGGCPANRITEATLECLRSSGLSAYADFSSPVVIVVPPGVVHGYINIGATDALVLNLPNQLYAGRGKKFLVDEIRHEDNPEYNLV